MVSAEQRWVDPLLERHKLISKQMSTGTGLPSLPCSLAQSWAITQACSASSCVCFKPIYRDIQLFSLGKEKNAACSVSVQYLTEWDMTGMKFPGTNTIEVLIICVCVCGDRQHNDPALRGPEQHRVRSCPS